MSGIHDSTSIITYKIRRIYTWHPVYTCVANLTTDSRYFPYLGYNGYRLPPLSTDTEPIIKRIKQPRTYAVRVKQYAQLAQDYADGIIAIGTYDQVQERIAEAKAAHGIS